MTSDEERREVARRLRGLRPGACFDDVYEALGAYGPNPYASRVLSATEFARHLADLIEPSCDRDALLALAGDLEKKADKIIQAAQDSRFTGLGPRMCEAKHEACKWRGIASRIREACGEVE